MIFDQLIEKYHAPTTKPIKNYPLTFHINPEIEKLVQKFVKEGIVKEDSLKPMRMVQQYQADYHSKKGSTDFDSYCVLNVPNAPRLASAFSVTLHKNGKLIISWKNDHHLELKFNKQIDQSRIFVEFMYPTFRFMAKNNKNKFKCTCGRYNPENNDETDTDAES